MGHHYKYSLLSLPMKTKVVQHVPRITVTESVTVTDKDTVIDTDTDTDKDKDTAGYQLLSKTFDIFIYLSF